MDKKPIRVLVADEHTLFRQCVCAMLARNGYAIAGEAAAAGEILELCSTATPDLVVLDLRFADGNGLDLMPRILARCPQLPILIVSGQCDIRLVEQAISLGARGYLPKQATLAELDDAIRRIMAGERVLHSEILKEMLAACAHYPGINPEKTLTNEEIGILRLCSEGTAYREISRSLFVSERTLYRKLRTIYTKLNASNRVQAVSAALKRGLLKGLVATISTFCCCVNILS